MGEVRVGRMRGYRSRGL